VRWTSLATLGISLAAHAGAAALLLAPRPAPPADPAPELAGETFELPAPETPDPALANASPSTQTAAAASPEEVGDAPARPAPAARVQSDARTARPGRPSAGKAASGEPEGTAGATGTAPYGAVGDRSATDLAKTFTRAFRSVASADPAWTTAPLGPAGNATVTLTLDESGHIEATDVAGAPSAALRSSIRRTMALIKDRPFVAQGRTTKLVLAATITTDTVHDGRFALGSEFASEEGTAFFALPIGRRIDLRVRLR
jgi:hypothetical protein